MNPLNQKFSNMEINKKIFGFILLILFPCFLNIQPQLVAQQRDNHSCSKQIIERYNLQRIKRFIPIIQHDTLLDNITGEIQSNKKFRKSLNVYSEESIREMLYENGIIDYQYEILEFPDKDMTSACTTFLLNDVSCNLRVGTSIKNNRNILFKTKSFLKFDHWEVSSHSAVIDALHNKSASLTAKVITEYTKLFMKTLIKDAYSYYTTDRIPLKSDKPVISRKKSTVVKSNGKLSSKTYYDLVFTLRKDECDKYLVIVNEKNERVAVLK